VNPLDLLNPLIAFLICLLKWVLLSLIWVALVILNYLLKALMAVLGPLFDLLPVVDLGSVQMPTWFAAVNWFFPVLFFVQLSLVILVVLVVWRVVAIGLRWLRVVA
jgi:hypothetical protein